MDASFIREPKNQMKLQSGCCPLLDDNTRLRCFPWVDAHKQLPTYGGTYEWNGPKDEFPHYLGYVNANSIIFRVRVNGEGRPCSRRLYSFTAAGKIRFDSRKFGKAISVKEVAKQTAEKAQTEEIKRVEDQTFEDVIHKAKGFGKRQAKNHCTHILAEADSALAELGYCSDDKDGDSTDDKAGDSTDDKAGDSTDDKAGDSTHVKDSVDKMDEGEDLP
eukprot:NODE_3303_length_947_cov_399.854120_g2748_i0.p2 GENE.NODE_3303_length_947_cov_399.854120_g2748_i0~~NODE_3303_length_947_cov_399.854120_g2748_i0.p2  ORF type:complete len:218 (+),score=26.19 NODE_3303_length_947_cov_399.854120_g2748_i0:145-798(+)